jgi:ribosomal protein S18 acetylase RimI-like enzyme
MNISTRPPVIIRPARPEDTPAALELSSHIWDGDDYVPEVWEKWLQDTQGCLLVAECEGRLAGFAKLSELTPQDWWMWGLRVHPEFQGKGIASQLHEAIVEYWQEHGQGAVRLSTHVERLPVHHLCERTGFRKVGQYSYFQAEALPEAAPHLEAVRLEETDEALTMALNNPLSALTLGYMDRGWEWLPPRSAPLIDMIGSGLAYWSKNRSGLLLMEEEDEPDEIGPKPFLIYIAGPVEGFVDLLLEYRRWAAQRGYTRAGWSAPLMPGLLPHLEAAGFKRAWDGAIFLFEKSKRL